MLTTMSSLVLSVAVTSMNTLVVFKVILECSELMILARRVGVSVCCEDSLRVGRCGNLRRHGADSPLAVKDIGVYWLVFDDMEELSKMPI